MLYYPNPSTLSSIMSLVSLMILRQQSVMYGDSSIIQRTKEHCLVGVKARVTGRCGTGTVPRHLFSHQLVRSGTAVFRGQPVWRVGCGCDSSDVYKHEFVCFCWALSQSPKDELN